MRRGECAEKRSLGRTRRRAITERFFAHEKIKAFRGFFQSVMTTV